MPRSRGRVNQAPRFPNLEIPENEILAKGTWNTLGGLTTQKGACATEWDQAP